MKLRTLIATAATAAILATSGVALAGAATGSDSNPGTTTAAKPAAVTAKPHRPGAEHRRMKVRLRLRKLLKGAGGVVQKTIGIDRATLRKELRAGSTIAQIATAHGSTPQAVIDALVAAANKKIDAAVTAGKLGSERATKIEQRLPARITKLVNEWHPKRARKLATG